MSLRASPSIKISATLLSIDSELFVYRESDEVVDLTKHIDDYLLAGTKGTNLLALLCIK